MRLHLPWLLFLSGTTLWFFGQDGQGTGGETVGISAPAEAIAWPLRENRREIVPIEGKKNMELKGPQSSDELQEADRAFAKTTAERGLDGWLSFMADDIAKVQRPGDKFLVGMDNIRQNDARIFANPDQKLVWEPVDAHLFADGNHGVTSGRYKMVVDEDGKERILSQGGYITWWRKQPDGTWKVIFDTGSPDPEK